MLAGLGLRAVRTRGLLQRLAALYAVGLLVSTRLPGRIGGPVSATSASVAASLLAGARAAWAEGTVRAVLIVTVLMNMLFFPYQLMLRYSRARRWARGPNGWARWWPPSGWAPSSARSPSRPAAALPHRRIFALAVLVAPFLRGGFAAARARLWPLASRCSW